MKAQEIAQSLRKASQSNIPISPIRELIGEEDVNLAYEIQQINTNHRIQNGARIIGKKIGLTSEIVQKKFNVFQPDFGMLFHDKEVLNGGSISIQQICQPMVEAEIAFVLKKDLFETKLSLVEVINAIDFVLPAIEIVGSRIKDWDIKITDTVADNASASHFVIGHQPKKLSELDLVHCEMNMKVNHQICSTGKGSDCLGSPLNAVYWLARKMIEMGNSLKAGEVILSGALGPFIPVKGGDFVEVSIDGLGYVSVHFED